MMKFRFVPFRLFENKISRKIIKIISIDIPSTMLARFAKTTESKPSGKRYAFFTSKPLGEIMNNIAVALAATKLRTRANPNFLEGVCSRFHIDSRMRKKIKNAIMIRISLIKTIQPISISTLWRMISTMNIRNNIMPDIPRRSAFLNLLKILFNVFLYLNF